MASVTLRTLWLNDADSLGSSMSFPTLSALVLTPTVTGEVRIMANGRARTVTTGGGVKQWTAAATLPACDRTQVQWVEDHTGKTVLVRDKSGHKFWGVYFAPAIDEIGFEDAANVTLTITQVTRSEVV